MGLESLGRKIKGPTHEIDSECIPQALKFDETRITEDGFEIMEDDVEVPPGLGPVAPT